MNTDGNNGYGSVLFPPVSSTCPCCFPTLILLTCLGLFFVVHSLSSLLLHRFSSKSIIHRILRYSTLLVNSLLITIALFFVALAYFPTFQKFIFFQFCLFTSSKDHPNIDTPRCDHFRHISGRVLEIGPGPGTNFRCWTGNDRITEWVGVDPNDFFIPQLHIEHTKRNLTFPISTIWKKGEDLDIQEGSFDVVVGAHVLCSVEDTDEVLRQIHRALKPSGKYYFFEHVAGTEGTMTYYMQLLSQPVINLVGNGCLFKKTWLDLTGGLAQPVNNHHQQSTQSGVKLGEEQAIKVTQGGLQGFDVYLKHEELNMPLSMLNPHIIGYAVKN